jgi:hypothetical protein
MIPVLTLFRCCSRLSTRYLASIVKHGSIRKRWTRGFAGTYREARFEAATMHNGSTLVEVQIAVSSAQTISGQ